MYPLTILFTAPPVAIPGAHVLNPRPCRAIPIAGKEIVLLSCEVHGSRWLETQKAKQEEECNGCWGSHPKKAEASVAAPDAASRKGGRFTAAGAKKSRSVSSRGQSSGTTPTSTPVEEEPVIDPTPELSQKNASKHQHEETNMNPTPTTKKVVFRKPIIGKNKG
ncbi:hypothetical protein Hanom_Chr07g00626921 [Helianthus anomalus]